MTSLTLIRRNFRYYARTNLGVMVGAFLAAMVLTGALITGDSLRHTLYENTQLRLGRARFAVVSSPRFFKADLANRLRADLKAPPTAVLQARGLCETTDAEDSLRNARVYGVPDSFWQLAPEETAAPAWGENGIAVNTRLAEDLGLTEGDELVLRLQPVRRVSADLTLSGEASHLASRRCTVVRVLDAASFGRFSLRKSQVAPAAVFMPRALLGSLLDIGDRANVLLIPQDETGGWTLDTVRERVREAYTLEDAELELVAVDNAIQLQSPRVFLDPVVERAALRAGANPSRYLTYFADGFTRGMEGPSTPFVFVCATDNEGIVAGLRDGEAVITDWLADDLGVQPGGLLRMVYLKPTLDDGLAPRGNTVMTKRVISQDNDALDRHLTPPYPGFAGVEDCADWDPGIPLDLDRVRPKDEAYWDAHGPTPRAFFTLSFGQKLWGTRFGNITSVRYPSSSNTTEDLRKALQERLPPRSLGVRPMAVFQEGVQPGNNAVNFSQLFLGLSFFLIAAAVVLIALLFVFTVEQRRRQTGLLRALGFPPRRIRRMLLLEGMLLALLGIIPGALAGALYNMGILAGLSTIWREAIGTTQLAILVRWQTLAWGAGVSLALSWLVLWFFARRRTTSPSMINLLHHESMAPLRLNRQSSLVPYALAIVLALGALLTPTFMGLDSPTGPRASTAFFLSGAFMLLAGFAIAYGQLIRLSHTRYGAGINLRRLGWRNTGRRPWRSMATVIMLGCGLFLVLAVGGNRQLAGASAHLHKSGTGGFTFYGESALDLDLSAVARARQDDEAESPIPSDLLQRTEIVPMLARGTEEANCLNLHRIATPRLLGVNPHMLADRGSFSVLDSLRPRPRQAAQPEPNQPGEATPATGEMKSEEEKEEEPPPLAQANPWTYLDGSYGGEVIPAITDQATLRWGLNKKLGDTIEYTDESGRPFVVKLVAVIDNSILQGSVVVAADTLRQRFTNTASNRVLLVDVPEDDAAAMHAAILRTYRDRGLTLTSASHRLQDFLAVQNTYLSIFLVLGGLGVLVGTAGLAVVISRNALERVREFAVLRATGYSRSQVRLMLIWEHVWLVGAAVLIALASAAAGMMPPLIRGGNRIPWLSAGVILAVVIAVAFFWVVYAAFRSTRGELLADLRHE